MQMYPSLNLFEIYRTRMKCTPFGEFFPDLTKRPTLLRMNYAINLCERWDHCMDIGGGNGHYLSALAAKFKTATLVEVATFPEHASLTTQYPNITIFQSYIEKYRETKKMDFVLMADLFEHIPDIASFTHQVSTLQEVGGVVYIMTPNPFFCGPSPESGLYHTRHPHGHIKHYTVKEITSLMENAGYRLEACWYEEGPFRQRAKWFLSGLIRRDTALHKYFLYRIVRPPIALVLFLLQSIVAKISNRSEEAHAHNPFTTLTHDLVFKKIT